MRKTEFFKKSKENKGKEIKESRNSRKRQGKTRKAGIK